MSATLQKTGQEQQVKEKKTRKMSYYSGKQKCQAVLSLWSERRKPAELCRELGVSWTVLNQWQDKALSAMMEALTPVSRKDEDRGPALGLKLEKMLEKTSRRVAKLSKLEKRLEQIQENAKE